VKVLTIVGTRPELIRLCTIIRKLDAALGNGHVLVDTGQNFSACLRDVFYEQLDIRDPDHKLAAVGSYAQQVATILGELELIIKLEKPDAFLVLGDTNSSLGAIIAKREGVPVYHMEAGNRCFSRLSPEETNRKIIDACTDVYMPYTTRSKELLLSEGVHPSKIFVVGNPIAEVLEEFSEEDEGTKEYVENVLVTLHREENVDDPDRLRRFFNAFGKLSQRTGGVVDVSTHPRLRKRLLEFSLQVPEGVVLHEPFGYREFLSRMRAASVVLTDSGTVQEECCITSTRCVILREYTERLETIEYGSCILAGCDEERILSAVQRAEPGRCPPEYLWRDVSNRVLNILWGLEPGRRD